MVVFCKHAGLSLRIPSPNTGLLRTHSYRFCFPFGASPPPLTLLSPFGELSAPGAVSFVPWLTSGFAGLTSSGLFLPYALYQHSSSNPDMATLPSCHLLILSGLPLGSHPHLLVSHRPNQPPQLKTQHSHQYSCPLHPSPLADP